MYMCCLFVHMLYIMFVHTCVFVLIFKAACQRRRLFNWPRWHAIWERAWSRNHQSIGQGALHSCSHIHMLQVLVSVVIVVAAVCEHCHCCYLCFGCSCCWWCCIAQAYICLGGPALMVNEGDELVGCGKLDSRNLKLAKGTLAKIKQTSDVFLNMNNTHKVPDGSHTVVAVFLIVVLVKLVFVVMLAVCGVIVLACCCCCSCTFWTCDASCCYKPYHSWECHCPNQGRWQEGSQCVWLHVLCLCVIRWMIVCEMLFVYVSKWKAFQLTLHMQWGHSGEIEQPTWSLHAQACIQQHSIACSGMHCFVEPWLGWRTKQFMWFGLSMCVWMGCCSFDAIGWICSGC